MDRPLSISGRVIYKENNKYKKKIINIKEPLCVITSEAIHQNNTANTISPISQTNEILNIVIIILGVVAIGAILGLVISRIISSVKQTKEKKKESAEVLLNTPIKLLFFITLTTFAE